MALASAGGPAAEEGASFSARQATRVADRTRVRAGEAGAPA
jgi:hypothetical protein